MDPLALPRRPLATVELLLEPQGRPGADALRSLGLDRREGLWAVARIPVANIIAMMAGRRALFAYARTLGGARPQWDKTFHDAHPAAMARARAAVRAGA